MQMLRLYQAVHLSKEKLMSFEERIAKARDEYVSVRN